MILTKHIKKRFFLTAILLLAGFLVSSEAMAAGMSVGNSTLNLGDGENIYYGVTSATNTKGNFLLLEKGYGNTVFKIDYNGNITTNGNLTGANSYWSGSGNNLFAATTYNVGIGTADAGAYKLNVNGNTNITGNLNVTGSMSSGGITGLTIAAPNVASGAFAANTGGGNFSFPANVGVGITTPVTNGGAASAIIHLNSATNTWSVFHSTNSSTGAAAGDGAIFGTIGNDAYIYNYEAGNLNFNTNGSTGSMVLNSAGNLGIGTTGPASKLEVGGNIEIGDGNQFGWRYSAGDGNMYNSIVSNYTNGGGIQYKSGSWTGNTTLIAHNFQTWMSSAWQSSMVILQNGNVGIGTTNPGSMLHLKVNGSKPYLSFETSGDNDLWALSPKNNYDLGLDSYWEGIAGGITTANVMYFKNDGNVGIGTAAPGAYKLYVNGNTNINGTLTATGITGVTVNAANVSAGAFAANTGGGNFSFSGSVGVGTTNPGAKLEIDSIGAVYSGTPTLLLKDTTSRATLTMHSATDNNTPSDIFTKIGTKWAWSQTVRGDNENRVMYFVGADDAGTGWNAAGPVLALQRDGRVGIGITDPGVYKLNVNGNTNITGTLNATIYTGGSMTGSISAANVSAGTFAANTGGGNFTFSGNLGIGTAASGAKLVISGGEGSYNIPNFGNTNLGAINIAGGASNTRNAITFSSAGGGNAQAGIYVHQDNSAGTHMYFATTDSYDIGPQARLTIRNDGNIGIGTVAPGAYKLNVNGTTNIASTLTAAGGANIVGNLVMSGTANITGIKKISVDTVDPLYNIHGTNYASFAASVVGGVKEEVTGKVAIEDKVGSEYQTVINFDKQTIGSDLWVWRKVIDFNKDNVEALITPYGSFANTYYYISGNSIVFKSDRPTEISYRLIAKRFDWKKWPTLPADQTEKAGLIIK